jgi:hypothetical protein
MLSLALCPPTIADSKGGHAGSSHAFRTYATEGISSMLGGSVHGPLLADNSL